MTDKFFGRRVQRIDELAQSVPPSRDLWPAIAAAIEADKLASLPATHRRRSAWLPAAGMAAAVALVSIGIFIGHSFGPATAAIVVDSHSTPGANDVIPASLRDAEYRKQRSELLVEVNARLKTMPKAERDKVAASLATLRRSISEIEAALGRDPANALLQELLVNSSQEEMRALISVRDSGGQET
jgi:hypothetical protein